MLVGSQCTPVFSSPNYYSDHVLPKLYVDDYLLEQERPIFYPRTRVLAHGMRKRKCLFSAPIFTAFPVWDAAHEIWTFKICSLECTVPPGRKHSVVP